MKHFSLVLFAFSLFSFQCISCPYQSMAELDKKLYSPKYDLTTEKFSEIVNLRKKGEEALANGEIKKSEEILNKALALIK
jgi:hypothetical protein